MSNDDQQNVLTRRERFLLEKERVGGDSSKLVSENKVAPYRVFFDDTGEIVAFTSDRDFTPKDHWHTHDFDTDQTKILAESETPERYYVKVDPKVDNLYSIELRQLDSVMVDVKTEFLQEIKEGKSADVMLSVKNLEFSCTLSAEAKAAYEGIYPVSATVKGQRLLRFYFTAPGDPHMMFHYETFSLADLLVNGTVTRKLPVDVRRYSVFTNMLFDTYVKT